MYFKSDYHKETALKLMQEFGFKNLEDYRKYGAFCYVAAATDNYKDLVEVVSSEGIDMDTLEQKMLMYSPSEMSMIRFALQLFSSELDDITIPEVFQDLDDENKFVVTESIKFRFNIKNPKSL